MIHYLTVDQNCWCNMRFLYSWSMPSFYSFSNVTQRDKSIFAEGQAWGITKYVYPVIGILVVTVVFHFKMTLFPYLVQIHLWGWGKNIQIHLNGWHAESHLTSLNALLIKIWILPAYLFLTLKKVVLKYFKRMHFQTESDLFTCTFVWKWPKKKEEERNRRWLF